MAKDKQSMPMSTAGLTRYFDESPETIKLKPEYVIGLVVTIIILEIFLYLFL
jgi:preprotein translocase subunit Sec61beta